jgi:cell wall-associated NlpC family hydrolase
MRCFIISSRWKPVVLCCWVLLYFLSSCDKPQEDKVVLVSDQDSLLALREDGAAPVRSRARVANAGQKAPASDPKGEAIVEYAGTLLGIPYKVAGKDEEGFDCSGFVSYVFKQKGIALPSSSKALLEVGERIDLAKAAPGDIILFTGTDAGSTEVGHVGIIVAHTADSTRFIHSSSACSSACVKYNVLEVSPGYQRRFMMVRRVLRRH